MHRIALRLQVARYVGECPMAMKEQEQGESRPCHAKCDRGLTPSEVSRAVEELYPRLRGLVHSQLQRAIGGRSAQLSEPPTALADELCMVLLDQQQRFRDREHLMAVASIRCMHIIVDYLRKRGREKRGGGNRGVSLPPDMVDPRSEPKTWMLRDGVDEALTRFAEEYPRQASVLMLRVFMERTTVEVAESLEVSTATVERDLRAARAYLRAMMTEVDG